MKVLIRLRKNKEIAYGGINIYASEDMLCVERKLEESRICLWINLSGEKKALPVKKSSALLFENKLEAGRLETDGFAIFKEEVNG